MLFQVRKNFFPPRPRRKQKRDHTGSISGSQPQSQYSSMSSQPLSQDSGVDSPHSQELQDPQEPPGTSHSKAQTVLKKTKRRSSSADRVSKRAKYCESSESESEGEKRVIPLAKTISDPAITIENAVITKKVIANSIKEMDESAKELCVICITEPKSGVFVHGRIAHICCCYKCAKKVWAKAKRCPVCNCKISNVLKAVVM